MLASCGEAQVRQRSTACEQLREWSENIDASRSRGGDRTPGARVDFEEPIAARSRGNEVGAREAGPAKLAKHPERELDQHRIIIGAEPDRRTGPRGILLELFGRIDSQRAATVEHTTEQVGR